MADRIIAGQPTGLGQPSGLLEPFILWDSRSWDGTIGVGTGGIANEGTAGSFFDLDVNERILGDGYYAYYAKQGTDAINAEWVTTAADWDDIGGTPCDGPVTMIVALGAFPRRRTSGVFTGFVNSAAVVNFFFRNGSNVVHWYQDSTQFNNDDGDASGFFTSYSNADAFDYPYAFWSVDSNPGDDLFLSERLLVISHDIADQGATFWRGDTPVPAAIQFGQPQLPWTAPDEFEFWDHEYPCDNGAAAQGSIASHEQFCYFGEHRSYAPLTPGDPWNGVIGAAVFRGEPTNADLAYWDNYFLNGYVADETPLGFAGGNEIRVDSTYVYHICRGDRTLTPVVGATGPATVDVFIVGGGGRGEDRGGTLPNGGGAAGQVLTFLNQTTPTGSIVIEPGQGGGTLLGVPQPGEDSVFDVGGLDLTAGGGGAPVNGVGGSNASFSGGAISGPVIAGGGGAGGSGDGGDASPGVSGDGGPGTVNDWEFGTNKTYGQGGGGGGRAPFSDPDLICGTRPPFVNDSGNGGNAQCEIFSDGNGTKGIVIMRYLRQD